jgi:hypothetical protein
MAFFCYYFKKLNGYLFEGDANLGILYESPKIGKKKTSRPALILIGPKLYPMMPRMGEAENKGKIKTDGLVKSRKSPFSVIPAKAGIQRFQRLRKFLASFFQRGDDFLRSRQD